MPGVSLLQSERSGGHGRFDEALGGLQYLDGYERRDLYAEPPTRVGWTGYPEYPVQTFETDSSLVVLEGHLYATADVGSAVQQVAEHALAGDADELEQWLVTRDAEFALFAVDKRTGDAAVLNDVLGRLPLYYASTDDGALVSRELGLPLDVGPASMDPMGVAQFLLFGYPLGERTLYDGVRQVEPGSLLWLSGGAVSVEQLHEYRFDRKPHGDRSVEENAERLAELFSTAVERRAGLGRNVVSLSGGLDSRAIAACFAANDIPFVAATFDRGEEDVDDVAAAREVADALGAEWNRIEVPPPAGEDLRTLLSTKRGMNYLGMGFVLEFFERIRAEHGPGVTYVTGDGGDKIFPAHRPKSFETTGEVVDYLLEDASRFDLETVTDLVVPTAEEIVDELRWRLDSYAGADPDEQYDRFLFRERGAKWLFHGEDRNRYYFWSVAPFWSWPMVEYAMKVPNAQKRREKLYGAVMERLSTAVTDVEYANFGAPITSMEYKVKRLSYDTLSRYPPVRDALITLVRGETDAQYPESVASVLQHQVEGSGVGDALSRRAVKRIAADRGVCGRTEAYNLLTATAAAERLDGPSSLAAFADSKFE